MTVTAAHVRVPVPQPGALVEVRARQWVVRDVRPCSLPRDPVGAAPRERHNLVTLASVEEDALGEETTLVWEVEPGASVRESFQLPDVDGFDQPDRLDAFLDAVRWGAVSQADLRSLQAPFRSGIEIEDYQLGPVVRALSMPRVNLLVADDVGLGKTIEAGLVVQELALGHGFHDTPQGLRYTLSPPARREVLDRLLELNHQRHAEEMAQGLPEKGNAKSSAKPAGAKAAKKKPSPNPGDQLDLGL